MGTMVSVLQTTYQTQNLKNIFPKENPQKPYIRPIVSSCDGITENISQFVDKWLQPQYVKKLPSYVKDTIEFINQIEATQLPTNCKLASIDV